MGAGRAFSDGAGQEEWGAGAFEEEPRTMSGGNSRWSRRVSAPVVLCVCVLMHVFAPCAACAESAAVSYGYPDTTVTSRFDTLRADTARTGERPAVWKMDELKQVLVIETGGLEPGMKYGQRKNGRVAMACAFLVPGLGQIYNEKPLKAAIVLGVETFYLSHIFMNRRFWAREKDIRDAYDVKSSSWTFHDRWVKEYWERSIDWIWWSGAVVLVAVIDAYVDAHLDDMRFRVEPRAVEEGIGVSFVVPY